MVWPCNEDLGAIQALRVDGRWGRGRPKLTWEHAIRVDINAWRMDGTLAQEEVLRRGSFSDQAMPLVG